MKQGSFEHEIYIEAAPKKISDFLADLNNQGRIHPLIINVREEKPAPAGILRRYFITDQLVWGPFHFKITYRADVFKVSEAEMLTEAYQSPGTYITNLTTFTAEGTGTRLHETVTLKSPDLLFGYAFAQADTSHAELVKKIKRTIEALP